MKLKIKINIKMNIDEADINIATELEEGLTNIDENPSENQECS